MLLLPLLALDNKCFDTTTCSLSPAGALLGIFLARHISAVMPLAHGKKPWGTRDTGLLLVVLTAVCALTLGLVTLWVGLLLRHKGTKHHAAPKPTAPASIKGATITPAAAALPLIGTTGQLVATGGTDGSTAPLALVLPPNASVACGCHSIPVATGRPDTRQLVSSWLTLLKQLPVATPEASKGGSNDGSRRQLQCSVLGCGPTPLLHDTQLLVQDLNAQQARCQVGSSSTVNVRMHFVAKTFAL